MWCTIHNYTAATRSLPLSPSLPAIAQDAPTFAQSSRDTELLLRSRKSANRGYGAEQAHENSSLAARSTRSLCNRGGPCHGPLPPRISTAATAGAIGCLRFWWPLSLHACLTCLLLGTGWHIRQVVHVWASQHTSVDTPEYQYHTGNWIRHRVPLASDDCRLPPCPYLWCYGHRSRALWAVLPFKRGEGRVTATRGIDPPAVKR
ncbi:hypothetical protein B0T24DRAFT_427561 [Lasiosphaeria ovina]|uniref:Uncharacterized protein n=1 Tax=Lasiosphaeria ovina TaxID=92902 RepID=A0AAE0MZI6_9PEZI|nr:hypothetical protein B0T24DRAFT_427561 [Lasiosphaeria ovina]